jgi:hypothetical protein
MSPNFFSVNPLTKRKKTTIKNQRKKEKRKKNVKRVD